MAFNPNNYQIPEEHSAKLRQMIGQNDVLAELPPVLMDAYWEYKRTADRISCRISDSDLVRLVVQVGGGSPTDKEQNGASVEELFTRRLLKSGDQIEVMYHMRWRPATVKCLEKGMVVAQVNEEDKDMRFQVRNTRLPQLEPELVEV